jgi:purine-binding chemotaxis protein CheW
MSDNTTTAGEFLSFTLGDEQYGVDILKVQEIRGYDAVTRLPDAPEYIKGVINLRGTIVPVIDLRLKLRLKDARYDAFTVMIVLNVEDRVVGIVVDSVSDVIPLNAEQIRPTPEFGASVDTRFISGIGTVYERMLILLDIETLINSADLTNQAIEAVAA